MDSHTVERSKSGSQSVSAELSVGVAEQGAVDRGEWIGDLTDREVNVIFGCLRGESDEADKVAALDLERVGMGLRPSVPLEVSDHFTLQ